MRADLWTTVNFKSGLQLVSTSSTSFHIFQRLRFPFQSHSNLIEFLGSISTPTSCEGWSLNIKLWTSSLVHGWSAHHQRHPTSFLFKKDTPPTIIHWQSSPRFYKVDIKLVSFLIKWCYAKWIETRSIGTQWIKNIKSIIKTDLLFFFKTDLFLIYFIMTAYTQEGDE